MHDIVYPAIVLMMYSIQNTAWITSEAAGISLTIGCDDSRNSNYSAADHSVKECKHSIDFGEVISIVMDPRNLRSALRNKINEDRVKYNHPSIPYPKLRPFTDSASTTHDDEINHADQTQKWHEISSNDTNPGRNER